MSFSTEDNSHINFWLWAVEKQEVHQNMLKMFTLNCLCVMCIFLVCFYFEGFWTEILIHKFCPGGAEKCSLWNPKQERWIGDSKERVRSWGSKEERCSGNNHRLHCDILQIRLLEGRVLTNECFDTSVFVFTLPAGNITSRGEKPSKIQYCKRGVCGNIQCNLVLSMSRVESLYFI